MNSIMNLWLAFVSFLTLVLCPSPTTAQILHLNPLASNVTVEGTSNIHDWEMSAKELQGSMQAQIKEGQLVQLNQLQFGVGAESLHSGKRGMDKKAYKALDTDNYKRIIFELTTVKNMICTSKTSWQITTTGELTIAGIKKNVELAFDAKVAGDRVILTGSKKINMKDFKVDPPTAMFGTITTGEEVNILFEAVFSE